MPNTKILKENGQEFYPVTHASLIVGMENQGRMDATYAWDGTGTPDITKIPAGVVVTYEGTSYTGTLAASADTAGRFYLVPSTTVTGEYDRYLTDATGSTITWKPAGTTAIPTPSILDNVISTDTDKALSANQGKLLKDDLSQLEAEVHNLSGKYYGIFEADTDLPEGDAIGYAFVGTTAPFAIYQFDGTDWADSGATVDSIQGEPGVGLDDVTTHTPADGAVVLHLSNGNTITIDMNHEHEGYCSKVLGGAQPSGGFLPDVVYSLGTLTGSVTFSLASPVTGNVNHYFWMFDTSSTAPTITWPSGLTWAAGSAPSVSASRHYEISVLGGVAYYSEV